MQMYEALEGKPATIRFLDPPLHEFLPHSRRRYKSSCKRNGFKL